MKSSFPKRFMSLRDKNGLHRRSKSSEPGYKSDTAKQAAREEEEKERLAAKIESIASRNDELRFHNITKDHIRYALLSRYAEGDVDKAIDLIRLQQQAFSGILLPYNPDVEMLGAENRGNVTCYLDALLFAMYAKLSAFECMLHNDLPSEVQRNLAALIRLWVNMLRSGKLIRIDMTENMQEALADCGWKDARLLEQQDTSEAFAFITETLQLPLLTLQVDLFHQGKRDDDDHKVVYERLLNLAVPPDPEGKGLKLEDCLEDYFNTKVDVLRDSLEEKKAAERSSIAAQDTIRLVPAESSSNGNDNNTNRDDSGEASSSSGDLDVVDVDGHRDNNSKNDQSGSSESDPSRNDADANNSTQKAVHSDENFDHDPTPIQRRWTMLEPYTLAPGGEDPASPSSSSTAADPRAAIKARQRSASIIQRIVIEEGEPAVPETDPTLLQQFKRQGSTIIKAVTIPAWQFFRLIPWHSTSNSEPQNDIDVARQFNKRPVVGICLKRYMMNESGEFLRHNTYIDIPDSLRLPYFMMADDGQPKGANELSAEYKLVLQSVVCHRGLSLHSGHYISFARVNPKLLTDNRRHELDPPPDYEEEQWVKFDDLADKRVDYVSDIKAALKGEMPYLLFYQIMPMVDLTPSSTHVNDVNDPPSYLASTIAQSGETLGQVAQPDADRNELGRPETTVSNRSSYFETSTWGGSTTAGPSIRFSSELERPPRISLDNDSNASLSVANTSRKAATADNVSRRGSLGFTGSVGDTPGITPEDGRSPVMTPALTPAINPSEESSTAQRLSRAAARLTGKSTARSRPTSQAGESRISLTMSRLGGIMRSSKEPLRPPEDTAESPPSLTGVVSMTATPNAAASSGNDLSGLAPGPATDTSTSLSTIFTSPAATSTTDQLSVPHVETLGHTVLSSAPQAQQPQASGPMDERGRQRQSHHHHHHHYHLRRGRSKSLQGKENDLGGGVEVLVDGTDGAATTGAHSGKGKDKEKPRNKIGVPERECVVM
ncbi:ubiquitin hydrolase [Niveomyces insectorum RCEF 264]|uniref:ubiquitinyl hydrolase 1 n=1 Tax=Niveomyces insectorum RCEF 264 TaxID=1081102 RepID=A0A167ZAY1_9HYPO|nr:ubiquitin hydrolase [Niveomyces insectorum RCEF 264]